MDKSDEQFDIQQILRLLAKKLMSPDLVQDWNILRKYGAITFVPDWGDVFVGPVEELAMPDGEPLKLVTNRPIPEGYGLLITSDNNGGITVRLAQPKENSDGSLSMLVPETQQGKLTMYVPGPDTKQ